MTGFTLQVIGSSCAVPNRDAATASYLVSHEDTTVMLDAGHGSVGKLRAYRDPAQVCAVVVTHMHPDHCMDLVALRNYLFTRGLPRIPVHLPPTGAECLRDLGAALRLGRDYFDPAFDLKTYRDGAAFGIGSMEFLTAASRHNADAHLIGVRAGGRRLVYTGDTAAFDGLVPFAAGCDALLVEATDPPGARPAPRRHLGPDEIAAVLTAVRPATTVLTHYDAEVIAETHALIRAAVPGLTVHIAQEGDRHEI
jgi:ribonuclease BN (tRNA processing enzyme)